MPQVRESAFRPDLGTPISEPFATVAKGGSKRLFERGALYTRTGHDPVAVVGRIHLAYESLSDSAILGLPTAREVAVEGGVVQEFERGRVYARSGSTWAHEVHGPILDAYLAAGGPRRLGFPITDVAQAGRCSVSVFERASIYAAAGTFVLSGPFRDQYEDTGGPTGPLGLPISSEHTIPNPSGTSSLKYVRFDNGTILRPRRSASPVVVWPFRIHLGRVNTAESDPWSGQGANDIYLRVAVDPGSGDVVRRRFPSQGDYSTGSNIVDVNREFPLTINPTPGETVSITIEVFDADKGSDDRLGTWTHRLTAGDAWGLGTRSGVINSGKHDKINSITAAIHPIVDPLQLTELERFWSIRNTGTDRLTWSQYASAFTDVDNERDSWDPTDWLDRAFYELVVQGIAEPGNCVGMSLEAIYSRKSMSLFSLPLNRYRDWDVIRREVNIKHCYQVGAPAIYWYLSQFASGRTHNPVEVFRSSQAAFDRGDNPVLCVAQNYDFTGAPHCVLPVAWEDSADTWKIAICDPSHPSQLQSLSVDPEKNTFTYQAADPKGPGKSYAGGEWTGGRLHYIPFSVLSSRPRTPVWDAILLMLAGTVILFGEATSTTSITTPDGMDLDGGGERARNDLQTGASGNGYFVRLPKLDGSSSETGTILFRRGVEALAQSDRAELPSAGAVAAFRFPPEMSPNRGVHHSIVAAHEGKLRYLVKQGLTEVSITSDVSSGEHTEIEMSDLSNMAEISVRPDRSRSYAVEIRRRVGVKGDRLMVRLLGITGSASHRIKVTVAPEFEGIDVRGLDGAEMMADVETETPPGRVHATKVPLRTPARLDLSALPDGGPLRVLPIR